jgi:hypothetical protein
MTDRISELEKLLELAESAGYDASAPADVRLDDDMPHWFGVDVGPATLSQVRAERLAAFDNAARNFLTPTTLRELIAAVKAKGANNVL